MAKEIRNQSIDNWIPITKKELKKKGIEEVDVVLISGDAYIDHPSFGTAVIARIIEREGFSVAISPQPNWQDDLRDFKKFGRPKHFFAVTSGCMDSMVNHYTSFKRIRSDDAYTPGGEAGFRPDYAITTYCNILKEIYPDIPVVIGGIEASLRRNTHYDYWSDKLLPSILYSSKADLLIYGMGEKPLVELIKSLKKGASFRELTNIKQTAYLKDNSPENCIELNSHESLLQDKFKFIEDFKTISFEKRLPFSQKVFDKYLVINPASCMSERELDSVYKLPFTRLPHPKYKKRGVIKAYEMIKNSINTHRGCFGGCSFCAIAKHQGKKIISRSEDSIIDELVELVKNPEFKGTVSDVGGPTANMYMMNSMDNCDGCKRESCLHPNICKNIDTSHLKLNSLLKSLENIEGVKHLFISSGVRYDLIYSDDCKDKIEYMESLILKHTSGKLKVAPEHSEKKVLDVMNKGSFDQFIRFKRDFDEITLKNNKKLLLIPYFISSHPGCNEDEMRELSKKLKNLGIKVDQIQDFTPTPMTRSSVIYYTGIDPKTLKKVFVERDVPKKRSQKSNIIK